MEPSSPLTPPNHRHLRLTPEQATAVDAVVEAVLRKKAAPLEAASHFIIEAVEGSGKSSCPINNRRKETPDRYPIDDWCRLLEMMRRVVDRDPSIRVQYLTFNARTAHRA